MTKRDVRAYVAPERAPVRVGYRGLDVYGMGPPSSGGSTVGEALNILEAFSFNPADRTRALHLYLEASRFSFADRNAYLADPDYFDVPLDGLVSDGFAAERRALIDPGRAAVSPVAPGISYLRACRPLRHAAQSRRRLNKVDIGSGKCLLYVRSSRPAGTESLPWLGSPLNKD